MTVHDVFALSLFLNKLVLQHENEILTALSAPAFRHCAVAPDDDDI